MQPPHKLLNRNFVLLWQAQTVSRLGTQGFLIAMLFWIKHATGSATLVGLLQMLSTLPAVLIGPIAGAVVDRYSRRNILVVCDLARSILVLSLAGLIYWQPEATQTIIAWLFMVSILSTTAGTFFEPAVSASIPALVQEDKIASANSVIQSTVQLSIFIGQGIGGTLFRLLGAPALFLINASTYLFAGASETLIAIPQTLRQESSRTWRAYLAEFVGDIRAGLSYIWNLAGLREMVLISALMVFFTTPVIVLLPFFIEDVLKSPVDWYGFLLAAYGVGTVVGYLLAGALKLSANLRRQVLILMIILEACGYGALGLVTNPFVALALAILGGLTGGFFTINITTILQIRIPSEMRGRVFALLGTISAALSPLAMGLAGVLADLLAGNIPAIYVGCGVFMAVLSILVCSNQDFRRFLSYDGRSSSKPVPEHAASIS